MTGGGENGEEVDHDVAIVGGGPAGCSAGVFTARYGLDTVVFDRGRSSIQRCAYLENYLGFPAGIDVETFYGLIHDHVETAGCDLQAELVESVDRRENVADRNRDGADEDGEGFLITTQEGTTVTARRIVAATRYDGEYMRGLDADEAMFETHQHGDGEEHEHFRRDYADPDGRTPVDGLYVASPSAATDRQAIVAAGRGARAGLAVVEDVREDLGFPESVAEHYDWVRQAVELEDEWQDRDRWRTYFDERTPDDFDPAADRHVELREAEIDRRLDSYVAPEEIDRRSETGWRRLSDHFADEQLLEHVADEQLLDHVDDAAILDAAREIDVDGDSPEVTD